MYMYSVGVDKVTGLGLIGTNWAFELFATWVGLGLGGSGPGLDKVVYLSLSTILG